MKLLFLLCLCVSGALFLGPILIGLLGVLLPAFGYFPALGTFDFSLSYIASFLSSKSTIHAIWLSLFIGITSSLASVMACFALMACGTQRGFGRRIMGMHRALMGPLIALPHSTIAIALLFLLAPSGFFIRLISPEITGFMRPPAFGFVPDQTGWLLIAGLMMKEIPFLLFIALAQSQRLGIKTLQDLGRTLGYRPVVVWCYVIWPQIYRQMRLPILAVLAYSLSVVDMTLILGPSLPPPLAILLLQGFQDADLQARLPASAGALIQIIIIIFAIGLWLIGEVVMRHCLSFCLHIGTRLRWLSAIASGAFMIITAGFLLLCLGLCAIFLWAFANRWSFADKIPSEFGLRFWQTDVAFGSVLWDSLIIAGMASFISLCLSALWLEALYLQSSHNGKKTRDKVIGGIGAVLFMPLFVPQISLLFGLQVALSWSYLDGMISTVIVVHCLYIMPYSWLMLAPAYHNYEPRFVMLAKTMGYGPLRHFLTLRLPLLSYSFASAFILGVCVSIALYVPTIFAGAGRITTVTTEAVTLAASGSRGPSAQAAMMQMLLPLLVFVVIRLFLRWRFGAFTGMQAHHR